MRAFTTAAPPPAAAIATAAPSIATGDNGAVGSALLKAREECIYDCACGEPTSTEGCCTEAAGLYDGSNLCDGMNVETHDTFVKCCAGEGYFCQAPIGCPA